MTDVAYFPKGTTFTCSAFLPDTVPDGFFDGWELKAEMRRKGNSDDIGVIAQLDVDWLDPGINRQLTFYYRNTSHWPVCPAEIDVLFTNADGEQLRTSAIELNITRGVTQ